MTLPTQTRFFLLALVALSLQRPARAAFEDEVDGALGNAARGEYRAAADLGVALIDRDSADWRGWYLRFLGVRERALTGAEREAIERIRPLERRETIRGLLGYVLSPGASRLLLARDLVRRYPSSGLAQTLFASSLLAAGQPADAAAAARTALALEPDLLLAGRIELSALEAADAWPGSAARVCELLRRFPHDSMVVEKGLVRCPPDDDPRVRFSHFGPVLDARRGKVAAVIALGRILATEKDLGLDALSAIVERLDPRDESWWMHGERLLEHLERSPDCRDTCATRAFLRRLVVAATERASPMGQALLERASLTLARSMRAGGGSAAAQDLLDSSLGRLSVFRRRGHLEELSALAREQGRPRAAERYELDLHILSHPFELPPRGRSPAVTTRVIETRTRDLFPGIEPAILIRAVGGEERLEPRPAPRLLVFWTAYCTFVAREAERIRSLEASPSSVLRRHDVDVLWINTDSEDRRAAAQERMVELGLDRERVFFERGADSPPLHVKLGAAGSPWLALLTPDGKIVFEMPWFNEAGWMADVDRILSAFETWNRRTSLVRMGD